LLLSCTQTLQGDLQVSLDRNIFTCVLCELTLNVSAFLKPVADKSFTVYH
jgi:hypothetical protein